MTALLFVLFVFFLVLCLPFLALGAIVSAVIFMFLLPAKILGL